MVKSLILSSALVAKAYAIYNQKYSGATESSFSVTWEDYDHSMADSYRVTATGRGDGTSTEVTTGDASVKSATFEDLMEASIYDVTIQAWNATADAAIGGHNGLEARTQGSGAFITGNWTTGAHGLVMWPISDEKVCGRAFNFLLPCPQTEMVDLGVSDMVTVQKSSNDSMSIYVSNKAHLSYINWVAFGSACNWDSYIPEDFIVESFQGYEEKEASSNFTVNASWPSHTGAQVTQISVSVDEAYRTDCAPDFRISIPCDASHVGGWSFVLDEGTGEYDGSATTFTGTLSNDWISEFGFSFGSDLEEDCTPEVFIVYQERR